MAKHLDRRGYIKLYRRFQSHFLWETPRVFSQAEAWLDILMSVQHSEQPKQVALGMNVFTCHQGESLRSLKTWAHRWQWSKGRVRRFLKMLENASQIETRSETVTTRIKVVNFAAYHPSRNANESQSERERNASETQADLDNNVYNEKNGNNESLRTGRKGFPPCPQQKIIALYHEILPELPKIKSWSEANQAALRARWQSKKEYQDLEWWRGYFETVRCRPFLMGQVKDWKANLAFLVKREKFDNVLNGMYQGGKDGLCHPTTFRQQQQAENEEISKAILAKKMRRAQDESGTANGNSVRAIPFAPVRTRNEG